MKDLCAEYNAQIIRCHGPHTGRNVEPCDGGYILRFLSINQEPVQRKKSESWVMERIQALKDAPDWDGFCFRFGKDLSVGQRFEFYPGAERPGIWIVVRIVERGAVVQRWNVAHPHNSLLERECIRVIS